MRGSRSTEEFAEMSDVERAYCAGLYEGEGSVCFSIVSRSNKTKGRLIAVSLSMTDREPLHRLAIYTGLTRITGPYVNSKVNAKAVYRWTFSGRDKVEAFFSLIKPWLSPRRIDQFEDALEKYDSFYT